MKTLLFLLALAAPALAQSAPSVSANAISAPAAISLVPASVAPTSSASISVSAEYPWRLQVDFAGSSVTSAPLTCFYRKDVAQGSTMLAQPASAVPSLTVDLVAKGASTVSVGGVSYTYAQALQILTAILAAERAAQTSN